jgi:SAM-dependent methyltransferase
VLEVGGGIGAVAACLAHLAFGVVAIESGGPGFEDMLILQRAVDAALTSLFRPSESLVIHPIGVEDLDPEVHGRFDVVLYANVLEHVGDPLLALDRMQAVLKVGGIQTHVCPNYAFPYEPHFFVPLLPFRPAATRKLLPRSMTGTGLWASLNFVTARQVRRWARRAGLDVRFTTGVLAEALDRFVAVSPMRFSVFRRNPTPLRLVPERGIRDRTREDEPLHQHEHHRSDHRDGEQLGHLVGDRGHVPEYGKGRQFERVAWQRDRDETQPTRPFVWLHGERDASVSWNAVQRLTGSSKATARRGDWPPQVSRR